VYRRLEIERPELLASDMRRGRRRWTDHRFHLFFAHPDLNRPEILAVAAEAAVGAGAGAAFPLPEVWWQRLGWCCLSTFFVLAKQRCNHIRGNALRQTSCGLIAILFSFLFGAPWILP